MPTEIVVLAGLGRTPLWPHDRTFNPGNVGAREAHRQLAEHAVAQEWDQTILVVQDDVHPIPISDHHGDITSYWGTATGQWGWITDPAHVCPKAFTSTRDGWTTLAAAWANPGITCELWQPDFAYDPDQRGWRPKPPRANG